MDANVPALVLVVFAFMGLIIVARGVRFVGQHEAGLIERLGRYERSVGPGMVLLVPFLEDFISIDLRVHRAELRDKPARSAGGDPLAFDAEVRYQVVDAVKAHYQVQDFDAACALGAEEALRKEIEREPGHLTSGVQGSIAARARARLAEDAASWGLTITLLELHRIRALTVS